MLDVCAPLMLKSQPAGILDPSTDSSATKKTMQMTSCTCMQTSDEQSRPVCWGVVAPSCTHASTVTRYMSVLHALFGQLEIWTAFMQMSSPYSLGWKRWLLPLRPAQ